MESHKCPKCNIAMARKLQYLKKIRVIENNKELVKYKYQESFYCKLCMITVKGDIIFLD